VLTNPLLFVYNDAISTSSYVNTTVFALSTLLRMSPALSQSWFNYRSYTLRLSLSHSHTRVRILQFSAPLPHTSLFPCHGAIRILLRPDPCHSHSQWACIPTTPRPRDPSGGRNVRRAAVCLSLRVTHIIKFPLWYCSSTIMPISPTTTHAAMYCFVSTLHVHIGLVLLSHFPHAHSCNRDVRDIPLCRACSAVVGTALHRNVLL
jgi:hypothetical protein